MEYRRKGMSVLKNRKRIVLLLLVCFVLTGCSSDAITDQTRDAVSKKTDQVLALYSDVEKKVNDHSIEVDQSFKDMKQQLMNMSGKVKAKLKDATEKDGKQALSELNRLENNLLEARKNVESHIAGGNQ